MDEITYLRNSWNTVLELINDRNTKRICLL